MVEAKDKSGSVTDEEESNYRATNSSKMEIYSSPGGSGGDYGDGQGCISCGIQVSGIRARGVRSENMEMFSCSPT